MIANPQCRISSMSNELNIKPLTEIAEHAMFMLGDYLEDDQWEELGQKSDIEKI